MMCAAWARTGPQFGLLGITGRSWMKHLQTNTDDNPGIFTLHRFHASIIGIFGCWSLYPYTVDGMKQLIYISKNKTLNR